MDQGQDANQQPTEVTSGLSADALRGRQSVRATFTLPLEVIELLSIAADQLGLKQKSLFDQLVEDRANLERMAGGSDSYQPVQTRRRQKTFVVSRNSLVALEHVARLYGLPRDLLVEMSIQRLIPVISDEKDKQERRKAVLTALLDLEAESERVLNKTEELLGDEDPATRDLVLVLARLRQVVATLEGQVEQGRKIEGYL